MAEADGTKGGGGGTGFPFGEEGGWGGGDVGLGKMGGSGIFIDSVVGSSRARSTCVTWGFLDTGASVFGAALDGGGLMVWGMMIAAG